MKWALVFLAVSTAVQLVPYADPEGAFRMLRPAAWKVQRVEVGLMETVFYRDHPRRGPRVVVIPGAPVAATTLRRAACSLLQYVRPSGPATPGSWPEPECRFPWSFRPHQPTDADGEATWTAGSGRERTLFWVRLLRRPDPGTLQVDFLAAVAPAGEFAALRAAFLEVLSSYRARSPGAAPLGRP